MSAVPTGLAICGVADPALTRWANESRPFGANQRRGDLWQSLQKVDDVSQSESVAVMQKGVRNPEAGRHHWDALG